MELRVMAHACNPRTQVAETEGLSSRLDHATLHDPVSNNKFGGLCLSDHSGCSFSQSLVTTMAVNE